MLDHYIPGQIKVCILQALVYDVPNTSEIMFEHKGAGGPTWVL